MLTRTHCPGCGGGELSPVGSFATKEAKINVALCESCGLAFVNPMFEDAEKNTLEPDVRALHRSRSAQLSDAGALTRSRKRAARWNYAVGRWLKPGSRVLEVGAGDGAMVELLKGKGHEVIALDPDAESCAYLARRFGVKTLAKRIEDTDVHAAATEGSPPREGFDAVFMLNLIEHLEDPAAVMAQLRGVLVEGGIVGIETPNILRTKVGPRRMFSFPHNYYFSPQSLQRLVEQQGYETVQTRTYPFDMLHLIARKRAAADAHTLPSARGSSGHGASPPLAQRYALNGRDHAADVRRAIANHKWAYYLRAQYLLRKIPRFREWYLYGAYRDHMFATERSA